MYWCLGGHQVVYEDVATVCFESASCAMLRNLRFKNLDVFVFSAFGGTTDTCIVWEELKVLCEAI